GSGISWNWGSRVLEADKSIRTYIVVVVSKLHSEPFVAISSRCETEVPGVSVVANLLDSVSCLVNISRCSKGDPANRLISDTCPVLLQAARADAGQEVVRRGQFTVKVGSQLVAGPEPHANESGVEVDVNKVLGARDVAGSYVVGVVRVVVGHLAKAVSQVAAEMFGEIVLDVNLVRFCVLSEKPCEDRIVDTVRRRADGSESGSAKPGRSDHIPLRWRAEVVETKTITDPQLVRDLESTPDIGTDGNSVALHGTGCSELSRT